jgi:hypothetical protein
MDNTIPIMVSFLFVSFSPQVTQIRERIHTSTDNLVVNPPLANHGKQKRQRIYDRDRQAQF